MCPHPLHKKRGHRGEGGGGGGDGTKKIKKTYKLGFFLSKKGAVTGSTLLWLEGGGGLFHPFHYRALTGVLHGTCSRASTLFSIVVVVQSQWQI